MQNLKDAPRLAVKSVLALTLVLSADQCCLLAQSISAGIVGIVEDSQRAVIQKATVLVVNKETNAEIRIQTDALGQFRLLRLEPGDYRVKVSSQGFSFFTFESVPVTVGEIQQLRATLEPEASREQITVTADDLARVAVDVSGEGRSYNAQLTNELPRLLGTTGRSFRSQAFLTPGVVQYYEDGHLPFSVSGARPRNNNTMIDSNDFNDFSTGLMFGRASSEQMVPSESIEGVQVLTHNFKAEYGRQSGSIMSMVSKSGSNEWHGSLYDYLRNEAFAARNTFDIQKQPLRVNLAGFTVGGRIRKDRTFVFGNFEDVARHQTSASTIQTLTTEQKARAAAPVRALANLYPDPNVPGTNLYRSSPVLAWSVKTFLVRIDHNLSSRQRLFSRSSYLIDPDPYVSGASFLRADLRSGNQAHSLHHIWTPSASSVNEARFNYSRFQQHHSFVDAVLLGNPAINGDVASVTTPGLSRLGIEVWEGQLRAQNNFQWTDDLSIQHGLHSFKTGAVVRRLQSNNGVLNDSFIGRLQFLNIEDFLAAKPQSYSRNIGNPYIGLRATEYNMYFQDDWRIHPRLTLNLGVRYELNTVPLEVNGLIPDRYRIPADHNNVAPRFGFSWRGDRSGKTVVRGGYGIYYNAIEMDFVGGTRFNPPLVTSLTATNPQFPNLLAGAQAAGAVGVVLPDPEIRNPYAQHFNLTIERQLWAPQAVLSTAYVGTASVGNARVALPNGGIALGPSQRPNPSVGLVNRLETSAFSSYHSLQTSLNWRRRDLTILASYTFSKLIDDVSDYSTSNGFITRELISLDERNRRLDRSVSDLNTPHVFKVAYSYSLPALRGNRYLGGWQAQGITTAMSGRPYTLYSGGLNLFGSINNRILDIPGALIRNSATERVAIALAPDVSKSQLAPRFGRLGTIGRNTERGDRVLQFDFSLFKTFRVTERVNLQLRAEAYNLFNTVNYGVPDNTLSSPNFGQALSAGIARQGQLALRLSF